MACNCKVLSKNLDKLKAKYSRLRKDHKKLLGVAVVLTDALEEFIKYGANGEILSTLEVCADLYPDLFKNSKSSFLSNSPPRNNPAEDSNSDQFLGENTRIYEPATESEKEFYEGFLARPRIARTPQQ